MSTRPRPSSQLPKPPTTLSPTAIIDTHAVLTGAHPITVSDAAVLHPRCRIVSAFTPVTIGAGSVVNERAVIGIQHIASVDTRLLDDLGPGIVLGANVVVETGATVAAAEVGEWSVIGVGAEIGPGAVLGKGCKVGPRCRVRAGEVLPDGTVLYGDGRERRVQRGGLEVARLRRTAHEKHLEALRRLIKSDLVKHGGGQTQGVDQAAAATKA